MVSVNRRRHKSPAKKSPQEPAVIEQKLDEDVQRVASGIQLQRNKSAPELTRPDPAEELPLKKTHSAGLMGRGQKLWMRGGQKAAEAYEERHTVSDPWKTLIDSTPAERAVRHFYDPEKGWTTAPAMVKIDTDTVFAAGAMRNCHRMKMFVRHSTKRHIGDWTYAENYVAKEYINTEIDNRAAVKEDIRMQIEAKKWADAFNDKSHEMRVPTFVDMIYISGVELVSRPGSPMLCVERFIQGDYTKYNSNSGYVKLSPSSSMKGTELEHVRNTPQAFSHFTYEQSGGELIVVDIQGVGDLYTDPQIHTREVPEGDGSGDANLSVRGMAYFFGSHRCNAVCRSLGLTPITTCAADAHITENDDYEEGLTRVHSMGKGLLCEPVETRRRAQSGGAPNKGGLQRSGSLGLSGLQRSPSARQRRVQLCHDVKGETAAHGLSRTKTPFAETKVPVDRMTIQEVQNVRVSVADIPKDATPTGAIHAEMSRMHCLGIINPESPDMMAALFHFRLAAQHGVKEALWGLSQLYDGIDYPPLPGVQVPADRAHAAELALAAAEHGVADAVIAAARGAPTLVDRARFYERAIEQGGGDFMWGTASYQLMAEFAAILLEGGEGLAADPERAAEMYMEASEEAMGEGKMKLWTKYSMLSEEAYGYVE